MVAIADTEALRTIAFASIWTGERLPMDVALIRTGWDERRLSAIIAELIGFGRLELDGAEIIGAHGLTLRSTEHRIVHDGRSTNTWCAFDALGIPAALAIDADAITRCPTCDATLKVPIRQGVPDDRPFLTWMPIGQCEHVMRDFCAAANLFCSNAHVERWREIAKNPVGQALSVARVAELGRRAWEDVARMGSVRRRDSLSALD